MKVIVPILFLIMFSCHAQSNNRTNPNKQLTLEELKKEGYQLKEADTFMMKDGKLDIKLLVEKGTSVGASDGYESTTAYHYDITLKDGTYIDISGDNLSGYSKRITKKEDLILTSYGYSSSGNIEQIAYLYPNLFKKGTWYWYNDKGQINRLEEYDKPFKYAWEELLAFAEKKEISKEGFYKILRWIDEKTNQPFWSL